jgi:electron transfer flavoprotein alpha/beta subunit
MTLALPTQRTLIVAARPDTLGLEAARRYADRLGGDEIPAVHAGDAHLEDYVREADSVVVLDPGTLRARLTRDPAFTAPADGAARRALLARLAPFQDRVRWLAGPS